MSNEGHALKIDDRNVVTYGHKKLRKGVLIGSDGKVLVGSDNRKLYGYGIVANEEK